MAISNDEAVPANSHVQIVGADGLPTGLRGLISRAGRGQRIKKA